MNRRVFRFHETIFTWARIPRADVVFFQLFAVKNGHIVFHQNSKTHRIHGTGIFYLYDPIWNIPSCWCSSESFSHSSLCLCRISTFVAPVSGATKHVFCAVETTVEAIKNTPWRLRMAVLHRVPRVYGSLEGLGMFGYLHGSYDVHVYGKFVYR